MKQGINFHLKVRVEGVDLQNVELLEFAFASRWGDRPIKLEQYPGRVLFSPSEQALLIPWTQEETYRFPEGTVYMDTRITLRGTSDQPITKAVALSMDGTLFEEVSH